MVKAAFNKKDNFHQQIRLKLKEEISKVLQFEHRFYGAETWTLRKVEHKYLGIFAMW